MNRELYSNTDFVALKEELNQEILRRGTYKWWDPLTVPAVGEDRTPPLSIPDIGERIQIDETTYTVNNPSEGSIERTRNIFYPAQGDFPAGSLSIGTEPSTSAAQMNTDEMRNFLVGLAKIRDINLFYGRDEIENLAFRDPQGIMDALDLAKNDKLNKPLLQSDVTNFKNDPNGGIKDHLNPNYPDNKWISYPVEDGKAVMPSGEFDGEELKSRDGIGVNNFYDDYGAKPGDANFHPYNRYTSEQVRRDWNDQGDSRKDLPTKIIEGGVTSVRFGQNPRNPQQGNQYGSRPVYGGVIGACNVACFKAGTLVDTINGPVRIEDIKVGDEVLSQDKKYHKVYNTFKRECHTEELISIRATGTPIIYTTIEHPFWVKQYIGIGRIDGKSQQLYEDPKWVNAGDIKSRDKLCLRSAKFGNIHVDSGIAYLAGRWVGDGWKIIKISKNGFENEQFNICCSFEESKELELKMNETGIEYTRSSDYTCARYYITKRVDSNSPNQKLIDIIRFCGKLADGKYLSQSIFNWDQESIEQFLEGYIAADGCVDILGNLNRTRVSTTSKILANQISLLMRMLRKNPSWHERSYKNGKGFIQNREVNMRTSYSLSMMEGKMTRNYSDYDDTNDVVWASVTFKEVPDESYTVYNISVDEDPTYYADGVLVHNCTGMCYQSCDNECSESCYTTCWSRCGNACTSTCGNVCTGCSTMCYTSCKTKCENSTGYSCLKAGAKAVKITAGGGNNGEYASNTITYSLYTCQGCAYTCQFYPNKKTECWDSACMGKCFISCNTACSTSCYGGCVDNNGIDNGSFKTGIGRGCAGGCTLNCIGLCHGVCEGYCIQTCWHACKQTCSDNCSVTCDTTCGSGCFQMCNMHCTGCSSCTGSCEGTAYSRGCIGCGTQGGCTSSCQHDCNKNCIGWGCRSICGIDSAGACEANCRLNCMATSCTAMCEDACSGRCTTCVNSCGFQCGPCTSQCSAGCGAVCNITCSDRCQHTCELNCVHSCHEMCGGCSDLCYSCIGMCIGVCSVKCEDSCSSCTKTCGWWCDTSCNQKCFGNCDTFCIMSCSTSCSTFLQSATHMSGPERPPTSAGYIYPNPTNRYEERESFRLFRDPLPYQPADPTPDYEYKIVIGFDEGKNLIVTCLEDISYIIQQTSITSGVFNVNETTGEVTINYDMLSGIVPENKPNLDGGGGMFVITLYNIANIIIDEEIYTELPFGFEPLNPIRDINNNIIIIIQRDEFLTPEGDELYGED